MQTDDDRRATTYCQKCEGLRRIATFTRSSRFAIVERVGERWQETGETAWDHSAVLGCGHTKGLITL